MSNYTRDEILAGITRALEARDMPAVASLIRMLAVVSPRDAELLLFASEHHAAVTGGTA